MQFDVMVELELKIIVEQIRSLEPEHCRAGGDDRRGRARSWKGTRI